MTTTLQFQVIFYSKLVEALQEKIRTIFRLILGFLNKVPSKIRGYFRIWVDDMATYFRSHDWFGVFVREKFPVIKEREMSEDLALEIADIIYAEEIFFSLDEFLLFLQYSCKSVHTILELFDFELVVKIENTLSFLEGDAIDRVKCRDYVQRLKVLLGLYNLHNYYTTFPNSKAYALYQDETEYLLSVYDNDISLFLADAELTLMEIENYEPEKVLGEYYQLVKRLYLKVVKKMAIVI